MRFAQSVADDVEVDGIVVPENVVVVPEVTQTQIERAVKRLAAAAFASLRPTRRAAGAVKGATIHFDGGGESPGPITAACTVELSDGSFDEGVKRFDQGTHNTAEWHALILGLRLALKHGERHVLVKGDSMLVVKQINREWKTKNATLLSLREQAEELLERFESWHVEWIPRKENSARRRAGTGAMSPRPCLRVGDPWRIGRRGAVRVRGGVTAPLREYQQ